MASDLSTLLASERASRRGPLSGLIGALVALLKLALAVTAVWLMWRLYRKLFTSEHIVAFFDMCFVGGLAATSLWLLGRHLVGGRREDTVEPETARSSRGREFAMLLPVFALILAGFWLVWFGFVDRGLDVDSSGTGKLSGLLWGPAVVVLLFLGHVALRARGRASEPFLYPVVALLLGLGLVFLYRLGPDEAIQQSAPGLRSLFPKQAAWSVLGMMTLVAIAALVKPAHLHALARRKYVYLLLSALLIGLTARFGHEINGRRLWIQLGPMLVQTIEPVKVLLVLFLAAYLADEGPYLERAAVKRRWLPPLRQSAAFAGLWVLALVPVFLQRDFGPTFLLFSLFLSMFYVATGSALMSGLGLAVAAAAGALSYRLGVPSMVRTRVDMWLDPFGHAEAMVRAFWAVVGGGFWGTGLGQGMAATIPVVHSDYNFAAICEELGVVGAGSVLILYVVFLLRGARIAEAQPDGFRQILAAGLTTLVGLQGFIIVAGNTGLLPMTGITLPFVSYGGTSLLVQMASAGLLLALSDPGFEARR